jgi:hypothetical protein
MLDVLRQLWKEHGYLTEEIIRASQSAPHVSGYFTRFGSLRHAYQLIGFVPDRERTRSPRMIRGMSNEAILDTLRDLLRRHGHLNESIINGNGTGPCAGTIAFRFGGLLRAYKLIGYKSHWQGERHTRPRGLSDEEMLDALRKLRQEHGHISQKLIRSLAYVPSDYEYCKRFGSLSAAYQRIGFRPTSHPGRLK